MNCSRVSEVMIITIVVTRLLFIPTAMLFLFLEMVYQLKRVRVSWCTIFWTQILADGQNCSVVFQTQESEERGVRFFAQGYKLQILPH